MSYRATVQGSFLSMLNVLGGGVKSNGQPSGDGNETSVDFATGLAADPRDHIPYPTLSPPVTGAASLSSEVESDRGS